MSLRTDIKWAIKRIVIGQKLVTIGEIKGDLENVFKCDCDPYIVDCVVDLINEGEIKRADVKMVCESFDPNIEYQRMILLAPDITITDILLNRGSSE